jgi:hypothetical protein
MIDEALRAVADPTRRAILRLVRDDELAASFLEEMWSDDLGRLKVAAEREEWRKRARAGEKPRQPKRKETPR